MISSNYDRRRFDCEGESIQALVLHYTGMQTAQAAYDRLCDRESGVSAHYLIEESGKIHHLVDEIHRAWHAGRSFWLGKRDINSLSIGIELVNPGHEFGLKVFPKPQMQALLTLSRDIMARHNIDQAWVLAHSDISPDRKQDPGELFDWCWLAKNNVGLWPEKIEQPGLEGLSQRDATKKLHFLLDNIGYDPSAEKRIEAFQRRFRPQKIDSIVDLEMLHLAFSLLRSMGKIL